MCEGCKKRCWGPGAGGGVWEAWEKREAEREKKRLERLEASGSDGNGNGGKGKGRSVVSTAGEEEVDGNDGVKTLVVFACRHLWHRVCLEKDNAGKEGEGMGGKLRCALCL